jgi:hypothetical protein
MAGSRVNLPPITPVPAVDGRSDDTQVNKNDLHDSKSRAHGSPPPASQGEQLPVRTHFPKAERERMLANITRAGGGLQSEKSAGKPWNAGFALACKLVEALSTDKIASQLLSNGPPAAQRQTLTSAVNVIKSAIQRLSNADRLRKKTLESLQKELESLGAEDSNFLGFYAVMAVMSAMPKLAELIRVYKEGRPSYACARVNTEVQEFTNHVEDLLEKSDDPQSKELISMAKAAMKVPFEYLSKEDMLPELSMWPNLSTSLNEWREEVSGTEGEASQTQLEEALRSFIDASINPKPNSTGTADGLK